MTDYHDESKRRRDTSEEKPRRLPCDLSKLGKLKGRGSTLFFWPNEWQKVSQQKRVKVIGKRTNVLSSILDVALTPDPYDSYNFLWMGVPVDSSPVPAFIARNSGMQSRP